MTLYMVDEELNAKLGPNVSDPEEVLVCSVGVMAYNEEANISQCLTSLLEQRTDRVRIDDIVVVVSGSTDDTVQIVESFRKRDPRIRLITHSRREGKASAINHFLMSTNSPIPVIVGADTILDPDALENLVKPFADPEVGMTGGHPIPVNDREGLMGFAVHLMWELHHEISLIKPKLGELVAFRRVFSRIPPNTEVDEAKIEPLIFGQGYQLRYVREAIVYNRGPDSLSDFLLQRRRINAGHLRLRKKYGYSVSTLNGLRILVTLLSHPHLEWKWFLWTPAVAALEVYARFLGWWDSRSTKGDHHMWEVAVSTKKLK